MLLPCYVGTAGRQREGFWSACQPFDGQKSDWRHDAVPGLCASTHVATITRTLPSVCFLGVQHAPLTQRCMVGLYSIWRWLSIRRVCMQARSSQKQGILVGMQITACSRVAARPTCLLSSCLFGPCEPPLISLFGLASCVKMALSVSLSL